MKECPECLERDAELVTLRQDLAEARSENESLDSLRNFLGDMTIAFPVGKVIREVEDLRQEAHKLREALEMIEKITEREDWTGPLDAIQTIASITLSQEAKP